MYANVAFCWSDSGAETNEVLVSPAFQQLSARFLSAAIAMPGSPDIDPASNVADKVE